MGFSWKISIFVGSFLCPDKKPLAFSVKFPLLWCHTEETIKDHFTNI